jgi:hypothetical protein
MSASIRVVDDGLVVEDRVKWLLRTDGSDVTTEEALTPIAQCRWTRASGTAA